MQTYVQINDVRYPASITGRLHDKDWGNRASKAITLEMSYADAVVLFVDDIEWYIVQEIEEEVEVYDEHLQRSVLETIVNTDNYDNSEYNVAGSITDNRNGTITVKMGQNTAEELLAMLEGVL